MLGAGWAGGILASCGHEEKKKMSSFACRVVSQLLYPFFSLSLSLSPDSRRVWSATSRGADGPCPKASERPQNPRWCPSPAPGAAGPWRTPASLVTMRRASNVSPLFFCYPFPRSLGVSKLSRTFFFFFFVQHRHGESDPMTWGAAGNERDVYRRIPSTVRLTSTRGPALPCALDSGAAYLGRTHAGE